MDHSCNHFAGKKSKTHLETIQYIIEYQMFILKFSQRPDIPHRFEEPGYEVDTQHHSNNITVTNIRN